MPEAVEGPELMREPDGQIKENNVEQYACECQNKRPQEDCFFVFFYPCKLPKNKTDPSFFDEMLMTRPARRNTRENSVANSIKKFRICHTMKGCAVQFQSMA